MSADFPSVEGVEHRFVEANGIQIHVAEAGPADAPPVLLIHGWPQHWYMWRDAIAALRGEFRLLVPDLRGLGWSEAPGHGYDLESSVADQVALLDALGIERAFAIGHDWGGGIVMLLGIFHPERFERLINCNAPHPWGRLTPRIALESWRVWYAVVNATPGLGPRAITSGRLPRWMLTHGNVGDPFSEEELEIYLERLRQPERAEASTRLYRHYLSVLREGARGGRWRDRRIDVPTLILFGERDLFIASRLVDPDAADRHATDIRVELVPDSGHFIANERPELVAVRAREFFGGGSRAGKQRQ